MKLLWLGTSNDVDGHLPEEQRAPALMAKQLSETLGLEVDFVARTIWPTEKLPSLVESWMEKHEPDLVFLKVVPYWFCYESVPLKLQRKLGRVGGPLASAGLKAADIGWLASTPLFHAGRRLAQRTIGGATHFEPVEVAERIESCIRVILRNEDAALLVRGPRGATDYYSGERARVRSEARRKSVHQALKSLCEELHVVYMGVEAARYKGHTTSALGDRVHFDMSEQSIEVAEHAPWFIQAWEQQHSSPPAVAPGTPGV